MSLRIFTNESDIPKDLASKVIIQNDDFFDTQTLLSDKKIVREIISQVDNGSYHSENYFIPRNNHKSMNFLRNKKIRSFVNIELPIIME